MRYTVGQKYLFTRIIFTPGEDKFVNGFHPWCDTLNQVIVEEFECIEHRRVPGVWDDEVKYDGFIFKAGDKVFYNQYPRASYSQISDEADRRIYETNLDGSTTGVYFEDLAVYMNSYLMTIQLFREQISDEVDKEDKSWMVIRKESMEKFLDDLKKIVHQKFNLITVDKGLAIKTANGETEHYPNIPNIVFEKE